MLPPVDPNLTPQQDQAIIALLSETTIRKAAEVVGVHEKTLQKWIKEPVFSAALRDARTMAFQQSTGLLQKAMPLAVQVLVKVASDVSAPHSAKVSAASALLKHAREAIEQDDLAARVEAVERATKGNR